jgi:hypothetical protein
MEKDDKYSEYINLKKLADKKDRELGKMRARECKKMYQDFRERYKYHEFQCVLEYGDRYEGEFVLEHGYIFRNVPHIVISNH